MKAVLLLAHGTPDTPADVPAYLRNVTGCRPTPPSVLEEVQHRYSLIGRSPLTDITLAQARALEEKIGIRAYVGMRNWHPFITDTVQKMRADGVTEIVAICLAPQTSRTSVGLYRAAVEAADVSFAKFHFVEDWHSHPLLIAAFAERLRAQLLVAADAAVLFTAHSVPTRTVTPSDDQPGDPYETQCRETARLVAEKAGVPASRWHFAFQSQGMSGGMWIGPTVEETLNRLNDQGEKRVIIQPVGFVCDHVEVLYDIDIAFQELAKRLGIEMRRAESLNTSPTFVTALGALATRDV
jgi:protoporphyrin/coproporphyrin ferrochelatase